MCPTLRATLFNPGSAGFQPATPKGWHSRGYLPHVDVPGSIQFVTFRLADSMATSQIDQWKKDLKWHADLDSGSIEAIALRKKIEQYLDTGHGACHLRDPRIAQLVQDALLHFDGQRYRMITWCVMPNHVHVLIEVIDATYSLSAIIHSWKSFTATAANKMLGQSGSFWMEDYFDRFMRDDKHLASTLDYIDNNPVKAGLVQRADEWPWRGNRSAGFQPASGQDGRAPGYLDLTVDKSSIKSTIYDHPEFTAFISGMNTHFDT